MIDSHAHIQFEVYDEDREAMLKRAWDRGLSKIIVIGGEEKRNDQALAMAKSDERLRAVIGIHPLNAGEYALGAAGGEGADQSRADPAAGPRYHCFFSVQIHLFSPDDT